MPVFRGASPLRSEEIVHESQFRAATDRHGKQAGEYGGDIAAAGAASINRPTVAVASRTAVGYATTVLG